MVKVGGASFSTLLEPSTTASTAAVLAVPISNPALGALGTG